MRFIVKSIRSKLIAATLIIAIIIISVMTIISLSSISTATDDTLKETIKPLAVQVSETVNLQFSNTVDYLSTVVNSPYFAQKTTKEQQISYLESSDVNNNVIGYAIYNSSGVLQSSSNDNISKFINASLISSSINSKAYVIGETVEFDGKYGFTVAVPHIISENVDCVIVAVYDAKMINEILERIDICDDNELYIINKDKTTMFSNSTDLMKQSVKNNANSDDDKYKKFSSFIDEAIEGKEGYDTFEFDGEDYFAGYSTLKFADYTFIVSAPSSQFMDYRSNATNNIILVSLLLLVIVLLFAIFFAKTISRPIVQTTQRLRALSQGNLSDPVDVCYSKDELGVLSNSLEETVVSLRQYINLITVALTNISEGNLCHRVEGNFRGDFFKIKSTFNTILESLSDTFASINIAAEQVNSGAIQVSNAAQALSQGSTQQASSIEELSATLSDVANQITHNANAAKNAYTIVHDNTSAIAACNDDMTKMLDAMNEISVSSSQISKIIKVIDDISFQTNILALNAAVEAAREGSKGFGVVADEVRRLAAKSAEAAKQTTALIEESSTAVKRGSSIAEVTAGSLHEIVENSTEIKKLVKDISEASEHQSEAIVQINTGVDQISAVVAANTSSAVGSASASEELSGQSLILKNMIARFKLSGNTPSVSATSRYAYLDESDVPEDETNDNTAEVDAPATPNFSYPAVDFTYPSEEEPVVVTDESDIKIVLDDDDEKY